MSRLSKLAFSFMLTLGSAPALAADLGFPSEPVPSGPSPTTIIGLEAGPAYYAIDNGSNSAGDWADTSIKGSLSHTFWASIVARVSFETEIKADDRYQYFAEGGLGYKFKLTDAFSLTPTVSLGGTWNKTGILKNGVDNQDATYWVVSLAGDWKLTSQWTWNVFDVRWRDAFNYTWETPKVATGVTFNLDPYDAVYVNAGYSWKKLDTTNAPYDDLAADKYNIVGGYKRSF
jgi:hypothetical protein